MATRHITTLSELESLARDILATCVTGDSATVIALSGDLGAGKTAFVKELGKLLNVASEITSPTFVIMKSYNIPQMSDTMGGEVSERSNTEVRQNNWLWLTHIDAYRIESDDEMRVLGLDDLLKNPAQLVCIEWPEKIQNLIPENAIKVTLTLNTDGSRDVTYEN